MRPFRGRPSEQGVTLLELMMAALLIATVIASLLKLFAVGQRGGVTMRSEVRASALARTKLDDLKNLARRSSMDGTFSGITRCALAQAYAVTQVAMVSEKAFTWNVSSCFAAQDLTTVADVTSTTVVSHMIHLLSWVTWSDQGRPRNLTIEAYVADLKP